MSKKKRTEWLEAAYPKCLKNLRDYLRRFVGSQVVAEDLAHDAILRVYTSATFNPEKNGEGYLFVAARHLARDWSNLHSVSQTDAMCDFSAFVDDRCSVERHAITAELYAVVTKTMNRLPERQQRVLVSCGLLGFSAQETADDLKVSVRTVNRDLKKALAAVQDAKDNIEKEDGSLHADIAAIDGQSPTA